MSVIRVVWGTATGPTATSAYDAALADANVHNYNLVTVSSVVPAGPPIEVVGTAPDLGPVGDRLTVVQGRATRGPADTEPAVVGLGWARSDSGPGIFYEESGTDPEAVTATIEAGLDHGERLRDWESGQTELVVREAESDPAAYTTAVVCAVYGESEPVLSESASF